MPNIDNNIPSRFGNWFIPCKAVTGSTYTVTVADLGTCITNRGGGALAITLPDPSLVPTGSWVMVFGVAAGEVTAGFDDHIVALNNAAADAVGWTTTGEEIGNGMMLTSIGDLWFTEMHVADEGNAVLVVSA